MSAQDLLKSLYQGEQLDPKCAVIGFKPKDSGIEMICDCGPGGECCGY